MKSVSDLGELRGKRVLIRCDFNVPLDGDTITDDGRIRAALPTLTLLREAGAKVVIMAHLGRPKGTVNPVYSLAPVAKRLGELLGVEVQLAGDVVGDSATATVAALADSQVALLENVRYEPAEESKDEAQRQALAARYAVPEDRIAYVGDDYYDLTILEAARWSYCPSNAIACVQDVVTEVLDRDGGHGVVAAEMTSI